MKNIRNVLVDYLTDSLERLVDEISDNEAVKNIPYVKSVVAILKDANDWVDKRELEKLSLFFHECEEMCENEISNFMLAHSSNEAVTGRRFLDSICSLSQDEKRVLAGRIYKQCVNGKKKLDDYYRLVYIVDKMYFDDLEALRLFEDEKAFLTRVQCKVKSFRSSIQ